MSDVAVHKERPTAPSDKRQRILPKLAKALIEMVDGGRPIHEAAQIAGMSTHAVREAFNKPHVIQFVRKRKQMLRESISARNITRLAEIRDKADNMPAVQAIKLLEEMGDDRAGSSAPISQPGVTIVINGLASNATVIDAQANERQPVMQDDRTLDLKANDPRSARER